MSDKFEIQGLFEFDDGRTVWHPLYTGYTSEMYAKGIMGLILDQDPPELRCYSDLRVVLTPPTHPIQRSPTPPKTPQDPRSSARRAPTEARGVAASRKAHSARRGKRA